MNHDEKKRKFVEPELLKCEDSLDAITMGGYHGSGEPTKRFLIDWKHRKNFHFSHNSPYKWWK